MVNKIDKIDKIDGLHLVSAMADTGKDLKGEVQYCKKLGLLIPIEVKDNLYYLVIKKEVLKEMLEHLKG